MSGWRLLWISAAMCSGRLSIAAAQAPPPSSLFTIVSRTSGPIEADPGSTITLVYSLKSLSRDSLTLVPSLAIPDGWSVITGSGNVSLAPWEADTWVMSIFIPARAESGRYFLRVAADVATAEPHLADSIQVEVKRKRGLTLTLVDRPQYVVGGDAYRLAFRLRNRGNSVASIRLSASSLLDSAPALETGVVHLRPDEATTIGVRIDTHASGTERSDDVVQLKASEETAPEDSGTTVASARVIVVQPAGDGDPLATVPGTLRLRAATKGAGISPFELVGGGRIRIDREERVDFVLHGKSGLNSPFGEERDNRIEIRAPRYRARVGDNVFMPSTLTGIGQSGFGAGLDFMGGRFSGGAYAQHFRYMPGDQSERAAYVALNSGGALSGYRVAFNAVDRSGGQLAGKVLSSAVRLHSKSDILLDAELATSSARTGRGSASAIRLTGGRNFRYDLGHVAGDAGFAGPSRNAQNDYATFSLPALKKFQLNGTVSRSRFASRSDSVVSQQQFAAATIGATYDGRLSLEYSGIGRSLGTDRGRLNETQRFGKARLDQPSRFGNSWIAFEMGERGDSASNHGLYHQVQAGTSMTAGFGSLSVFTELYDGGSLTRGLAGMSTFGGSASLRLTESSTFAVFGYVARNHVAASHAYTQLDARLSNILPNGSTLSLRVRSATTVLGTSSEKLAYLEYSLPIGIPTGRAHPPGRANGTVIDGESGRGVPGVLVRLGPRAGVTDRDGRVSFAGLPPGEYRASLASEASISNATYAGNPVVKIDSVRREAPAFQLALSRASKIRGIVRQFVAVRTAFGAVTDSLEYSGPVEGIAIALVGASDTLSRTSALDGTFLFDELPAGQWTVLVESVVAPLFRIEHLRVSVTTRPGQESLVEIRILPKQKAVKIIAGS
jgi:hypothetical protein